MTTPPNDLTFLVASPRISFAQFQRVLERAFSPARIEARAIYDHLVSVNLCPAVALGFFKHESTYGRAGWAVQTLNWGNIRKSQGRAYKTENGFAYYRSWLSGLQDWADLIINGYVQGSIGRGYLDTIRKAIPVYAPKSDNNNPDAYIRDVLQLVAAWQAEDSKPVQPDEPGRWALWGSAYPLPPEQRGFAIPQLWLQNAPWLGSATSPEMYLDQFTAIRAFAGGWIVYETLTEKAHLGRRTKGLV
jgi:hypothetical protein